MEITSVTFYDASTNDLKYYKVSGIVHTSDYRPLLLNNYYALNYTACFGFHVFCKKIRKNLWRFRFNYIRLLYVFYIYLKKR